MYKYDINLSVCNQINVLAIYFSYSYQFHENGNVNSITCIVYYLALS